jgi:hypothetical protein
LKPDGVISLAFTALSDCLGRKIYLMLQHVFDGRPPRMWLGQYDSSVVFLESNNPLATLTQEATGGSFTDKRAVYANPAIKADVSTDGWPFFYMPRRVYPTSYLIMIGQILILSLLLGWSYFREAPQFSHLSFFFLGAGFMLIETKGITEMGLTFGNTWQVIGIVIAGTLIMAFLGNCAVSWLNIKRPHAPYLFLFAALALGWLAARSGVSGQHPWGG